MNIKNIVVVLILMTSSIGNAQESFMKNDYLYKYSIQLGASNFQILHDEYKPNLSQYSFSQVDAGVSYRLGKLIAIQAQFSAWTNWGNKPMGIAPVMVLEDWDFDINPGDVMWRVAYKMADVNFLYYPELWKNNRHELYTGLGVSYCWGKNDVAESVYQHFGYGDIIINSKIVPVDYWGFTPTVGYNFKVIQNHVNIGTSLKGRFYFQRNPQLDISLYIGYSFSKH